MRNREYYIGGEFEINPEIFSSVNISSIKENEFLYSSGRSALMAILNFVAKSNLSIIYVPYYICSSVVLACRNAGYKIRFYEINDDFVFPLQRLIDVERKATILTVNYFGYIDDNPTIKRIQLQRPDIVTISDQVQSIWTFNKSIADFSFTSLRKHMPVPDGAMVYAKSKDWIFEKDIRTNLFYEKKLLGSILKYYKVDDEIYLNLLTKGENELDCENSITRASKLSHYLYNIENWELNKEKRKKNYELIYELGEKSKLRFIFPYDKNVIPLCVPILVEKRDIVRRKLMTANIFLPIHWPLNNYNKNNESVVYFANNELSLVIDQRYSAKDIEYQIKKLVKFMT